MSQNRIYDLPNQLTGGNSLTPGTAYVAGSDENGTYVNARAIEGPVQALCCVGAVSGSPSAQSINFEMDEADDSSGTNVQKVAVQREVTLTADNTFAILHAITTKPFVRVVVDDTDSSYTDGTTPSQEVVAIVIGQNDRV